MRVSQKLSRKLFVIVGLIWMGLLFPLFSFAEININTPSWKKVEICQGKNRYVFLFIDDGKTGENKTVEKTLQEVDKELGNKSAIIKVMFTDKKEKEMIKSFRITKEMIPAVLVIAPNGAVTGLFSKQLDKGALKESIVSAQEAEVIFSLQEGRLVLLCFYTNKDPFLEKAKTELKAIETYFRGMVTTFYINSDDEKEKSLVKKLEVSDKTVVFTLVPPWRLISKLEQEQITRKNLLQPILSACGSGCGSGCE